MDVRSKQLIQEHLQKEDVQERILQNIHRGRDEATVTISRAAELFGITENKLRDWEEYGILHPLRPGGPKGRRLYTPTELDKLAIIRELINAGYAANDIPTDIYKLWHAIRTPRDAVQTNEHAEQILNHYLHTPTTEPSINQRIAQARTTVFWNYFVSHVLHMALKLICEDFLNTTAGLILPLSPTTTSDRIQRVEDVETLGESLVGWLSQHGTSHALLTTRPWFQYSSDFRVEALQAMRSASTRANQAANKTMIILQREMSPLTLSSEVVETVCNLLNPLYEEVTLTRACLGTGMRDTSDSATDFYTSMNHDDAILNGLADMIVHLGGHNASGEARWRFCWILLPRTASQPATMSNLTLRAHNQAASSPTKSAFTALDKHANYLYIRALQSRHILYEPNIPTTDAQSMVRDLDIPLRSALAMPLSGEDGVPLGVLYVASHFQDAFTQHDQRLLRILARMIEELLKTYTIRKQSTRHLTEILKNPEVVDALFENFGSENDFNRDVEAILQQIQTLATRQSPDEPQGDKVLSFIALDIDKYNSLAHKYGDRLARNLTREVGLRVQEQIRTFFREYPDCQLYHIYADRFFILLKNTSLEQAREHAERLRMGAMGPYKLDALRVYAEQQIRTESVVEMTDVSIRLGITAYEYPKLAEILREHIPEYALPEVRSIITSALDVALVKGQIEGGNVVVTWDYDQRNFIRWSPLKHK
ncbi:MerR family transcriptional regulator [Dictyobacter arantiisoli]|uniref:HTH merR-type domain-containing protein n=1 Tax=Dictyobacter arantiisoli TaxID=2014874 RepID=A0A5A5T9T7_9CHLR|nr:MerR family transcriptional regulator [Dictyobacter arantiisoli]GCF08271.1 hypothetical protein KDI_18350 [Dictyobacter arantiisoli]